MRFTRRFLLRAEGPDNTPAARGAVITAEQLKEKLAAAYKRADPLMSESMGYSISDWATDIVNINILKDGEIVEIDPSFTRGDGSLIARKIAEDYFGLQENEDFKMQNNLIRSNKIIISSKQFDQWFQAASDFIKNNDKIMASKETAVKNVIEQNKKNFYGPYDRSHTTAIATTGIKVSAQEIQEKLAEAYKLAEPFYLSKQPMGQILPQDTHKVADINILADGSIQIDPSTIRNNSSHIAKDIATGFLHLDENKDFKAHDSMIRSRKLIIPPDKFEECLLKVNRFIALHNKNQATAEVQGSRGKTPIQAESPRPNSQSPMPAVSKDASKITSTTANTQKSESINYYFDKSNVFTKVAPTEVSGSIRIDIQNKSATATITQWPKAINDDAGLKIKTTFAQSTVAQFLEARGPNKNAPVNITINPKAPEEAAFLKAALEKNGIKASFSNINDIPPASMTELMAASSKIAEKNLFESQAVSASTPTQGPKAEDDNNQLSSPH